MGDKILEAIVTGTAAALTWALLGYARNFFRTWRVEGRITKSFSTPRIGAGINGLSVSLQNYTRQEVRIRDVVLNSAIGADVILSYSGIKEYDRKLDLKALGATNEAVTFLTASNAPSFEAPVELDIEASATWLMPNRACLDERLRPAGGYCIVEYQTLHSGKKTMKVPFNAIARENLLKYFDHHRDQCLNNDFMNQCL